MTKPSRVVMPQPARTSAAALDALLEGRPVVEISAATELGWRLANHGLSPQEPTDLIDLARRHCGLHSARQLTPWVTVHARNPSASPQVLREAIGQRRLLRLRCMRRTLHLVPQDLAPIVHCATLAQRIAPCRLAVRRSGLAPRTWGRLLSAVQRSLGDRPLAYRDLELKVATSASPAGVRRRDDRLSLVRMAIKTLWEEGHLLVGDASPSLHHEHRTFELTELAVPGLNLNSLSPAAATEQLLPLYLAGYGPASVRDFRWWSGIGLGEALPAWESLADRLVRVRIEGRPDELVALDHTISALLDGQWDQLANDEPRVLAYEDPALKGYFATRWRYVDPHHQSRLFNTIGEARASLLVNGRVTAVWHWDRRSQSARLEPLARMASSERRRATERLAGVTDFLRSEPLLV